MLEYVNETLTKIDKADAETKVKMLKYYGEREPFNLLFSLNFRDDLDLGVPPGMPSLDVYKRDEAIHDDLTPSHLQVQSGRLKSMFAAKDKLTKTKREHIFLQIIEAIPTKEADVLIYAKDGALAELYPTITYDLMQSIFPNYCKKVENATAA